MAGDVVYTTEVIDAVLAVLRGADTVAHTNGLPANWFTDARDAIEVPLQLLEHGALDDYPWDAPGALNDILPAILVRSLALTPADAYGALSGQAGIEERLRIVHIRRFDQCRTATGAVEDNMTIARARYAKAIHKALFADQPFQKLAVIDSKGTRTEPTITGAKLVQIVWRGWDFGTGERGTQDVYAIQALQQRMWAIACDVSVYLQSGGPA